jgi:UDP-N-acetylmuramate dehydrogenase
VPVFTRPGAAPLSAYTTLAVGGPAARLAEAGSDEEIIEVARAADADGEPLLVLGGGSNLVVADDGFPGTVLRLVTAGSGISAAADGDAAVLAVAAGACWDQLVEWSIAERLAGLECLAGIPGLAGATPIQNVGAYGQEVAAVIDSVRVYDRTAARVAVLTAGQCAFGYRTSLFKRDQAGPTGRYIVLGVTFRLPRGSLSAPIRYAELAARLGVPLGGRAPLAEVRDAVIALRRGKGMVLDPADTDTASAGSFFTNPVLSAARFSELERAAAARGIPGGVPSWPAGPGAVKVPAAWLIEQAGFGKGYPGHGPARISSKHTLALTNAGGARTSDLIALAREITAGVRSAFGVALANEPVLVGVRL